MANFYTPKAPSQSYRRRLPHFQQPNTWCFITFRLADSLPETKLTLWRHQRDTWLEQHPPPLSLNEEVEYHKRFTAKIEYWLDQGSGSCVLKHPAYNRLVADTLLYFDQERYRLDCFVVMPNHVHALFYPMGEWKIPLILKSWKSFSAREINKQRNSSGRLWQPEGWDRLIRDDTHFRRCRRYILENPKKAGLERVSPDAYLLWDSKCLRD